MLTGSGSSFASFFLEAFFFSLSAFVFAVCFFSFFFSFFIAKQKKMCYLLNSTKNMLSTFFMLSNE